MFHDATRSPGWRPPFCPNPNCPYHKQLNNGWRYKKNGFFTRRTYPHRIQRYRCLHCGVSFSSQTFSTSYWLKRPDVLPRLLPLLVSCCALRQIARLLRTSAQTVMNQTARLGRHCMLHHAHRLQHYTPTGPVVIDGFESFELSQYHPFHHHLAVETDTSLLIYFTDSELRRKGRMTEHQKRRREELEQQFGRPDPKAVPRDVRHLLETVLGNCEQATVRSDDHRAYPGALRALRCRVRHEVTSSRRRRDRRNPLFEVNLLDLMLRHCGANHRRETLAWSKRRQGSAERLAVFLVWWNEMKPRRLKRGGASAAMLKGWRERLLTVGELLRERLFRTRQWLPERWAEYYDRLVTTRALPGVNRQHELRYAY
jgi:Transposase and inactivated derivatives